MLATQRFGLFLPGYLGKWSNLTNIFQLSKITFLKLKTNYIHQPSPIAGHFGRFPIFSGAKLPSWKLTASSPLKIGRSTTQKELNYLSQPLIFSGELAVSFKRRTWSWLPLLGGGAQRTKGGNMLALKEGGYFGTVSPDRLIVDDQPRLVFGSASEATSLPWDSENLSWNFESEHPWRLVVKQDVFWGKWLEWIRFATKICILNPPIIYIYII